MHSATLSKTNKCVAIFLKVVFLEILKNFLLIGAADFQFTGWNSNKKELLTGILKSSFKFPGRTLPWSFFQPSALGTFKISENTIC